MVNGWAAASEDKRMVFAVEIAWFGAILKYRERPIIEIGLRSLFPNSGVGIRQ